MDGNFGQPRYFRHALLLSLTLLLAPFFDQASGQNQTIGIGGVFPTTNLLFGPIAAEVIAGIKLGIEAVNNQPFKGGLLEKSFLQLKFFDGLENATLFSDLSNDPDVYCILGPAGDIPTIVALNATDADMPIIAPYTGAKEFFSSDPFLRRVIGLRGGVGDELVAMVEYATNTLRLSRLALADGTYLPSLKDTLDLVLANVGQRLVSHVRVANTPTFGDIWTSADSAELANGGPGIVIIGVTPVASAQCIVQTIPLVGDNTVFMVTSNSAALLPNLLKDFTTDPDVYEALLRRIYVMSHLNPFRTATVPAGSIVDEFRQSYSSTSLSPSDFPDGFPNDMLAIEAYFNVRWIGRVLETMSGVPNVTRANFQDAIYSAPLLTIADKRAGLFLDDCTIDGVFGCCNNGIRELNVLQLGVPPNWDPSNYSSDAQVGILTYAQGDKAVFRWDGCTAVLSEVVLPYVFGMSVAVETSGTPDVDAMTIAISSDVQIGLLASMEQFSDNPIFGDRALRLVSGDNNGQLNISTAVAAELMNLDNVISMVGYSSASQAFADVSDNVDVAVFGLMDPSLSYRKVQYRDTNDPFADQVIFVVSSVVDNAVGAFDFLRSQNQAGRVVLWYDESNSEEVDVVQRAIGELFGQSVELARRGDSTNYEALAPSAVLLMPSIAAAELVAEVRNVVDAIPTPPPFVLLGTLEPEHVVEELFAQGLENSFVYFAQGMPALGDNSSIAVERYLLALSEFDSNVDPTYAGLLSHVAAGLISSVLQRITGTVTPSRMLDAVYVEQRFTVDGLSFGPFVKTDDCAETKDCCNQGLSDVYVQHFVGNSSNFTRVASEWATIFSVPSTTCGVDISAADDSDSGDLSAGEIAGIVLGSGAIAGLALCVLLCGCICIVLLIASLVALLLLQTWRVGRLPTDMRVTLKEPDYANILFNNEELDVSGGIERYLQNVPMSVSGKTEESTLDLFSELLQDSKHKLALIQGMADNYSGDLGKMCLYLVYCFHHDGQLLSLLTTFVQYEVAHEEDRATLFRADSLLSKMFAPFSRLVGLPYVWHVLAGTVNEIHRASQESINARAHHDTTETSTQSLPTSFSLELDPLRAGGKKDGSVQVSTYQLKLYAITIFQRARSKIQFPELLQEFFHVLATRVEDKFENSIRQTMCGFVFLRFLCVALSAPHRYGILDEPPSTNTLRSLILLSKVLQNLANGVTFLKEAYMQGMNDFILENMDSMSEWLNVLASGEDYEAEFSVDSKNPPVPKQVYAFCIKSLYGIALSNATSVVQHLRADMEEAEFLELRSDYLVPLHLQVDEQAVKSKPGRGKKRRSTSGAGKSLAKKTATSGEDGKGKGKGKDKDKGKGKSKDKAQKKLLSPGRGMLSPRRGKNAGGGETMELSELSLSSTTSSYDGNGEDF